MWGASSCAQQLRDTTTGPLDFGPPIYVVSKDTAPNATHNPAFELAYSPIGFEHAGVWMERLGEEPQEVLDAWTEVRHNLAPLLVNDALYEVYKGIFWDTPTYTSDHPVLAGSYGWLTQTTGVNLDMAKATSEKVGRAGT